MLAGVRFQCGRQNLVQTVLWMVPTQCCRYLIHQLLFCTKVLLILSPAHSLTLELVRLCVQGQSRIVITKTRKPKIFIYCLILYRKISQPLL